MINIKYFNKEFKIYANGKIISKTATKEEIEILKDKVDDIMFFYAPSNGFHVSYLASKLTEFGIEVTSYKDYEMLNSSPDRIY